MKELKLKFESGTTRVIITNTLESLEGFLHSKKVAVIADENLFQLHNYLFQGLKTIIIPSGESNKSPETISRIYDELIKLEADRDTFIIGAGGGVTCDLAGFAAATFMRSLRFGLVPSTLLAQADAAIGGKNGINYGGYKNLIGTTRQPEFTICSLSLLKTLSPTDISNGMAEIIKTAAIGNSRIFEYLENSEPGIFLSNSEASEKLLSDIIQIKADIVAGDESDHGTRRVLNFGHTIGHAVEAATGLPHGQAISIGMMHALRLSEKQAGMDPGITERLGNLLSKFSLPLAIDADPDEIISKLKMDKKKDSEFIKFVLLRSIGEPILRDISIEYLINTFFESWND